MSTERRSGAERRLSVTVVLVDDEPLIRTALAQALSAAGLELVGEAATGEAASRLGFRSDGGDEGLGGRRSEMLSLDCSLDCFVSEQAVSSFGPKPPRSTENPHQH